MKYWDTLAYFRKKYPLYTQNICFWSIKPQLVGLDNYFQDSAFHDMNEWDNRIDQKGITLSYCF